ncbi:hypothetical protein AAG906_029075 [Vitis piasezkii]
MEMLETEFMIYARLGMLIKYKFYCPSHNTKIVESRNAKFLEYDLVNGSNQFRNINKQSLKFNQSLKTNRSLKFHKLLTTFQDIKLIGS